MMKNSYCHQAFSLSVAFGILTGVAAAQLRIPGATAYLDPDVNGARVSSRSGVTRWTDPQLKVLWFGEIKTPGALDCAVTLKLPKGTTSKLRLTLGEVSKEASVKGVGDSPVTARFGAFQIAEPGYQKFTLESLNPAGQPAGDITALLLDGPAIKDAHFNINARRNAASVHLFYPVPRDTQVEAFYCEMTGLEEPLWTYYMACGWHRGYFGMQVNSPTERRIIFSVWDSGAEAVDRGKVADDNRVVLVGKGEGVYAGDFGNEGTGGHSHLKYLWKTGEKQRFVVTAEPVDETHTVYSGYYFHPDKKEWMLISSWKAPKEGGYLRGLYSFSENFGGANGHLVRKALYGNQWIRTADGKWIELTTAGFSHDVTGKADRLDRFMGMEGGQFFLSHGGFVPGFTQYGEKFTRPATGTPPADIKLPEPGRSAKLNVYFGTYTGNTSKGIYRSTLDLATGRFSEPVLAAEAKNPTFLEIHPNGKFLYAVGESGTGVVGAYAIQSDGGLAFLNQQPSNGSGACHVNLDSAGKNVLVANYGSGSAAVIPVKPDGSLGEPASTVQHEGSGPDAGRQKGPHAHSVNLSPDDRFVFVADLGIDKLMIYRLDREKGTLSPNDPPFVQLKPGAGPRHFTFHPSGRFAYVINELDCTVTALGYNPASGALTEIQTVPTLPEGFAGNSTCAEVRVHPNGKFLYGSNRGHNSIAVYRIDPATGKLTFTEHETTDKTPRNFNIEPSGRFCLVASQDDNTVAVFQINQNTGALSPTGNKITVGRPVCIRFLKP